MPNQALEQALREALSAAPIGIYSFDPSGVVLSCGQQAAALLGWDAADLVGRPGHATFHHSDADGVPTLGSTCPILLVASSGRAAHAAADVFWRRDGSALPVWWLALPAAGEGERVGASGLLVFGPLEPAAGGQAGGSQADLARAPSGGAERTVVLGQLSELLNVLDLDEGFHRVAALAASALADWCVVDRLDGDRVSRVALVDRCSGQPALVAQLGPLPNLSSRSVGSLARVLRGEESVAIEPGQAADDPLRDTGFLNTLRREPGGDALDDAQAALFEHLGAAHAFVVPLRARDEVLGAMTWVRTDPGRPFTDSDILLATVFGLRVGLWLDSVRLYDQQKHMAETLQRSLLTALPQPDHLELTARYVPAAAGVEVGGDWYDAWITDDGRTMVVVGDVSGHDIEAAARMASLRNMLRIVGLEHADRPSLAVAQVDRAMNLLGIGGQASLIAVTVGQTPSESSGSLRHLTWTNAGHLPPLLLRPGAAPQLLETSPDLLLGVRHGAPRQDSTIGVPPGATLLLYTDGLVERPTEDIDVSLARLTAAAADLDDRPLVEVCDQLLARLVPTEQRSDDVAMIAIRFHDERAVRPPEAGPNFLPEEHADADSAAPPTSLDPGRPPTMP